jgi:hypothetical protein
MSRQREKRFLPDAGRARGVIDIAESLYKIPALVPFWTRCGKARCRCKAGRLHGPYHALYWRDGATQRRRYVRAADVPAVRAILATRRAARQRERLILSLSRQTWRELASLIEDIEARLRDEQEDP